jgi:hypothetical protein
MFRVTVLLVEIYGNWAFRYAEFILTKEGLLDVTKIREVEAACMTARQMDSENYPAI